MTTKEQLYHLIDELPDSELETAQRFLAYLRDMAGDPVLRAVLEAPEDGEPLSDEDRAALEEAHADLGAGRVVSDAELRQRLFGQS